MKGKRRRGITVTGIALIFALVLSPLAAHCAEKKGPIRIGFLTAFSGGFAAESEYLRNGFDLYLGRINYTVAGRKIEVLHEDDKNDPRTGLVKTQRLVEEKQVHIIGGVFTSTIAYAIREYIVGKKIPFVVTHAAADLLTQTEFTPYIFRTSFTNSQGAHVDGDYLYKTGHRRLMVLASDFSAGYENIGGFCRVFKNAGGEIVEEIYTPVGTIDFAPYLSRISPGRVDGLFAFLGGADRINLVNQYAQYGLKEKVPMFGAGILSEEVLTEMGDNAIGMKDGYYYKTSSNLKNKEHLEFIKMYKQKFGKMPIGKAEVSYVAAQLITKALQTIKGNIEDTGAFIKAMESVEVAAPRGPFKLDKYHNPIQNIDIALCKKQGKEYYFDIVETYPNVSQFWKWSPEEFMKMPLYKDLKGKWAKGS